MEGSLQVWRSLVYKKKEKIETRWKQSQKSIHTIKLSFSCHHQFILTIWTLPCHSFAFTRGKTELHWNQNNTDVITRHIKLHPGYKPKILQSTGSPKFRLQAGGDCHTGTAYRNTGANPTAPCNAQFNHSWIGNSPGPGLWLSRYGAKSGICCAKKALTKGWYFKSIHF